MIQWITVGAKEVSGACQTKKKKGGKSKVLINYNMKNQYSRFYQISLQKNVNCIDNLINRSKIFFSNLAYAAM